MYGCGTVDIVGQASTGTIGDVIPQCTVTAGNLVSLDGISFHADQ